MYLPASEDSDLMLRMPPANIECEEAILGALLLDREAYFRVSHTLVPEKFSIYAHQLICKAIIEIVKAGLPVDLMTVATWLSDHHLLEKAGGQNKLVILLERTVSSANIDAYCLLLNDKYTRRQLIKTGYRCIELGHKTEMDLIEVKEEAQQELFRVCEDEADDKFAPESLGDCVARVFSTLESGVNPGFSTGLVDLDAFAQFKFTELIIVAGRAGMGKTWMGCHLAIHLAKTYNFVVIFFTAEMSKDELTLRLLSLVSRIDNVRLERRQVETWEWEKIINAVEQMDRIKIIIDDTPASQLTPQKIRSVIRKTQSQHGLVGAVVLDYLQKLGNVASANRVNELGAITCACKDIAKEFDVIFIALAQFKRIEDRSDKRPTMSDLRDCGWIEQEANLILSLYREDYYNPDTPDKDICEVGVLKNRNGKSGTVKALFKPELGGYQNLARSSYE